MKTMKGFTLIELAIVLVIIGLLLGGVLKGQELVNSAKVKNMANDFRNVPVQVFAYQDKFRALPGDDRNAIANVKATKVGSGDGIIGGSWSSRQADDESFNFWQHLRLAGLATGTTDTAAENYLPTNSEGGGIGVQSEPGKIITGLGGSYAMCSTNIPGKFVRQLDLTLDDGNTASGQMMASATEVTGTTAVAPVTSIGENATLQDATKYTVCMAF